MNTSLPVCLPYSGETSPDTAPTALRVLLVDDDPDDLMLIRDLVEANGGNMLCDVALGFDEGMTAIDKGIHDAYLIDFRLGARTGLELIQRAALGASGPMVLLTGMGSELVDRDALASGAADYLSKRDLTTESVQRSIRYTVEMWRARRTAEEGEARYRSLFDGVPVGLFRIGPDGTLLEANRAAVGLLGYPDNTSLLGTPARELIDPAYGHVFDRPYQDPEHGEPTDVEVLGRDGRRRWVSLTLEAVVDASGKVSHVEAAIADITARKTAEAEAQLRGQLLDKVRSAVIVTDMAGRCTHWNRFAETMYGWSAQEAIGRDITELNVTAEDQDVANEIMGEVARTGHWEGEFTVCRSDGTTFPAQVSNSLLVDDRGTPVGMIGVSMDITGRKQAESAIREYQELHAQAFDASPVGKAILSIPDGRLISVNPALCDFLGYSPEELTQMTFAGITHPEDLQSDLDEYQRLASGEIDSYTIDKRYVRADGEVVWGHLRGSLIRDTEGNIRFGIGQVVDIDERKRAEQRIRFQASLLDQVHHAVLATDLTGSVIYWNKMAEAMYGWKVDEILGQNLFELTVPDADPVVLNEMAAKLLETGTWEGEVQLARKDGSTFQAWASDTLLHDDDGNPSGVVGVKVDLTELKEAEAKARTQEMLNRSLLESVDVPIAIVDGTGKIIAFNPSWDVWVGHSDTEPKFLPASIEPADEITPEVARPSLAGVWSGTLDQYSVEYSVAGEMGQRWFRMAAVPTEQPGAVVVHWDITDERFAREALEETIRMKDEFIAGISHELRTPLSVVVGLAELMRSGDYGSDDLAEFQHLIADQAQEMALIVEDLLTAGRIDSRTLTIRPEKIDLRNEIQKVILPWNRDGVTEIETPDEDELPAFADPLRVRQILRNLVSNAVRYGRPPVLIEEEKTPAFTRLRVIDHGDGIPIGVEERIFEQYATFSSAEGQPSSVGLGLHVARRLARLMGGDLTYRREGTTTVFELTLLAEVLPKPGSIPA